MNPELKAKWIEALRSGTYQQGMGSLRSAQYYCCLGVLCDVIDRSAWTVGITGEYEYQNRSTYLPPLISELSGVWSEVDKELATMNDEGRSFTAIADWIEANL